MGIQKCGTVNNRGEERGAGGAMESCLKRSPAHPVEVAAGLIFREGRLLIAQRYPGAHLGGLWEFPGGKREPEETLPQALERELLEELGIKAVVAERIDTVEHRYSSKAVRIEFFRCTIAEGEPRALGCHAVKWVDRAQLAAHQFPDADARLLGRLQLDSFSWT